MISMLVKSYAAMQPKEKLQLFSYEAKPLQADEVEITITHSGVCHSDLHLIDNDWGISRYPLVAGHEIVGVISAMGSDVKHVSINQRVGIGWRNGSCMHCEFCDSGHENLCLEEKAICLDHHGGFAEKVIANSHFVFPLPEKLSSAHAAPLLCAGITVYSPLMRYVKSGMKVGVIGLGGLGHLAVQFAHKMGADVTVFSTSKNKEIEAFALGAKRFVLTSEDHLEAMQNSLDFILSTVFINLDYQAYLDILRPRGVLCLVGVPQEKIQLPGISLIMGEKTLCGSNIGGSRDMNAMLAFCAKHDVKTQVEIFPMQEINSAIEKVKSNQVRYRAVLQA